MRRCRINLSNRRYRLIGHVVSQRGATYPVDYSYDEFGEKVSMTTYRNAGGPGFVPAAGDTTTWLRDEATGLVTNKVYADGKGPTYTYTPDGKLATRTWARGIVTTYSYDANGALTNTVYSDGTPTISLVYNRAGRQIRALDAAGVTTFLYDEYGSLTNEAVRCARGALAAWQGEETTNVVSRFYDSFGRDAGYALNGIRQSTLAYDPATGRLASMQVPSEQSNNPNNQTIKQFSWNYLAGSNLKSSLDYPNGLTASWTYDPNNQLLQVRNVTPTNTISQYDYMYDSAGRRITVSKSGTAFDHDDSIAYGYNARSELTNAIASVDSDYRYAYDFDDIGNRESSLERGTNSVYTSNSLNQYTVITDVAATPSSSQEATFVPQFDDDGNQTLVKTATGIWSVTYNGENRPVQWTLINSSIPNSSTPSLISMSFDRMGRRVTKNNQRFVYNGYLQIANFEHQTSNIKLQTFIWDPSEPIATRPLVWNSSTSQPFNFSTSYYTHDGNKNVSEVVYENGEIVAHYEYTPFGAVSVQCGVSATSNPWRFSSEYAEDDTAIIYYNYRHYEPIMGRWLARDPINTEEELVLYVICENEPILYYDQLGLLDSKSMLWHKGTIGASGSFAGDFTIGYGVDVELNKSGDACKGTAKLSLYAELGITYGFSRWFNYGNWRIAALTGVRFAGGVGVDAKGSFFIAPGACAFSLAVDGSIYFKGEAGIRASIFYRGRHWRDFGVGAHAALRAHLDGKVNCDVNKCVLDVDIGRVSFDYRAFIDLLFFSYEVSGTKDLDWTNPIKILHKEFESPLKGLIK